MTISKIPISLLVIDSLRRVKIGSSFRYAGCYPFPNILRKTNESFAFVNSENRNERTKIYMDGLRDYDILKERLGIKNLK